MKFIVTVFLLGLAVLAKGEFCFNDVVQSCGAVGE